ncbi:TRAP transporter small permease subunit [Chloroflexota bacterium]
MTEEQVSQNIFTKVISVISKYLFYVGVVAIAVSGLMTGVDVFARYLFSSPLPGVYQLQEIMLVAIVALPLAYNMQKKAHIRVDILLGRMRGKSRPAFELMTMILACILFAVATWTTGGYAWQSFVTQDYYLGPVHYPFWPAKTMIPLGCALLCLRLLIDIGDYGRDLFRRAQSSATEGGAAISL